MALEVTYFCVWGGVGGYMVPDVGMTYVSIQPKVSVLQISVLVTGHSGVRAKIPTKPHRLMT